MQTALQKWGNSQGVRIPRAILAQVKWVGDEKVEITAEREVIMIRKAPEPVTYQDMYELFADYEGAYHPVEIDWGEPVGDEVW